MKTMKGVFTGLVFVLVTSGTLAGLAQVAVKAAEGTSPARTAPVTTSVKGVIKSINDTSIVVSASTPKKAEVTFQLTSAVKRTGTLTPGGPVTVTYYFDNGQHVVTSLTGKESDK
jgi:hypothetical protein